nr:NtaA/DmoA family FMN-dependent monooxygenase [Gammaproteobacteria bacterium]
RADEFMHAVLGHWDSWDDDALVLDRATGRFADASKVRRLEHKGEWFNTRGPFTVPRSPQGRPVVIQAGQSGRGRQFAARWGELVFAIMHSQQFGIATRSALREEVANVGRDPDSVRIAPAIYTVVGETQTIAEEKATYIEGLAEGIDTLVLLSEVLNFDFATKPLDEPFSDAELASISGLQAIRDRVVGVSGKKNPTTQDFIDHSGRGTVHEVPCFVGSATQVADQMEDWFTSGACDGFVLAATHIPGAYDDFVRLVVPELQRRGIYQKSYKGGTLRQTLGLEHPKTYDWQID